MNGQEFFFQKYTLFEVICNYGKMCSYFVQPAGTGDTLEPATLESIVLKRCSDDVGGDLSLGSLVGGAEVTHFVLLRHLA